MRRLLIAAVSALGLVLAFSSTALAEGDDVIVRHSGSPDSGTCGNNWANDTFTRVFHVDQEDNTLVLTEFYKSGHFVTVAGASPGGCQTIGNHGHFVTAGVRGSFHGFLRGTVTGGTYNSDATCPNPCNGTTFVPAFFGPAATWNVINDWSFSYQANDDDLLFRRWTNAGSGNVGDIATS
ncbi:MAG TPA: hypothetical protein VN906_05705 [Candidatus Sulfotelmatobacter sp.]|nr:hypothetical protein [Candidatus Sulfotelmatobacter sp.]